MGRGNNYLENLRQYGEVDVPEQSVEQLKKSFASFSDAIDASRSEFGAGHYKKAKQRTLTIRNVKRKKMPDLMAVFEKGVKIQEEEEEETKNLTEADIGSILVKSDRDLAELTIDVIHECFYNPKTGLWPNYDEKFDRHFYLKHAKPGWDAKEDSPARLQAREEVNRLKNQETTVVMEGEFVKMATESVFQTIQALVSGVKQKDVKHAVRNHVRDHLNLLVYLE